MENIEIFQGTKLVFNRFLKPYVAGWTAPHIVCCWLGAATSLLQDVNTQLAVGTVRVERPESVSRLYTADQRSMDFKRPFQHFPFLPICTGDCRTGSISCESHLSHSNLSYFADQSASCPVISVILTVGGLAGHGSFVDF